MSSLQCYFGAFVPVLSSAHAVDGQALRTYSQPQNDRVDVAVAALDSVRSRDPSGRAAVIPPADRLTDERVARRLTCRLGYTVDSTGRGLFVVKLQVERLSLRGDSAEVVVKSTIRHDPQRGYVEVATVTLARIRGAWRVSSLRRDSIT